jgi:hypothetical protein
MSRWLAEVLRRPFRALASVALLALAPKCGMCVLAYVGLAAWLGFRRPEICGATTGPSGYPLAGFAVALGVAGLLASFYLTRPRRPRDSG